MAQNGTKLEVALYDHIDIVTCTFGMTHLNFLYCFPAVLEPLYDENGKKWREMAQNGTKPEVLHHADINIVTCKFMVTHLNFSYCFPAVLEPLYDENGKKWCKMVPNRKWRTTPTSLLLHASLG